MKKAILLVMIFLLICTVKVYASANDAIDQVPTDDLQSYLLKNNSYFKEKNIDIKTIIKNAFNGDLSINFKDYILYEINNKQAFFKEGLKTCINIVIICMLLTIVSYISDEIGKQSVSDMVMLISVVIVFSVILKDVINIKYIMKNDFSKFAGITEEINAIFLGTMLTFGKLSVLQFFQVSLNYVIGITTKYIYNFADIVTIAMISIILINNISDFINAKLLYKYLKKGTLLILSGYIIIIVINFSVQGYILYKTDNIFINTVKVLSPNAIPIIGSAVTNFFSVFLKSVLMIKDVIGFVIIAFILSVFGGSLVKILFFLIIYKVAAILVEPFNTKISKFIYEMGDMFYIYFISLATPIIIITVYYSILINYMNNIFG